MTLLIKPRILAGFCCDDRNCAPCLWAHRKGLALLGETCGKSVAPRTPRKPTLTSVGAIFI